MTAAALILHFLAHVHEARVERIGRYMETQWGVPLSTTYNTLIRLVREGQLVRVGWGRYQLGDSAGRACGKQNAPD